MMNNSRNHRENPQEMSTMKSLQRTVLSLALLLLFLVPFGCGEAEGPDDHDDHTGQNEEEGHDGHDDHHDEEGTAVVRLTPDAIVTAGITTGLAESENRSVTLRLPSVVALRGDGVARAGTLVPGRISRLFVSEGSYVKRGGALAEVESVEIGKVRASYLDAVATERNRKLALDRQERLSAENVGSERALEEARAAWESARAARVEEGAHLRLYGVDPATAEKSISNRILVTAPISGVVSSRPVTLGEYVEPADDMFTLVDISSVWIDGEGTPEQIARLAVGNGGSVPLPGGRRLTGRISYISPILNAKSRTATVRIEVSNPGGLLRPGSFVTAEYQTNQSTPAVTVPATAIDRDGGATYIWRVEAEGVFERVEVKGVEERGEGVVLSGGLKEGEEIVLTGTYALRSVLNSGELSEHHH